ncbi:MAG: hypothetical protein OXB88_00755 [Bacteriovoracales bacterium]|nr:hypothetical protein [Bacteriovoracales bacterium]
MPFCKAKSKPETPFQTPPPPLRPLNTAQWKGLYRGELIIKSLMKTEGKFQRLSYYAAGLHPRTCPKALQKISEYESYRDFISFIKRSRYHKKTQDFELLFDHTLLPFPMVLKFRIPRIKAPGIYPFSFPMGLLKGLKGKIQVSRRQGRCFMELKARWKGPSTKINDTVFEVFSITLGRIGIRKVFRVSSI